MCGLPLDVYDQTEVLSLFIQSLGLNVVPNYTYENSFPDEQERTSSPRSDSVHREHYLPNRGISDLSRQKWERHEQKLLQRGIYQRILVEFRPM